MLFPEKGGLGVLIRGNISLNVVCVKYFPLVLFVQILLQQSVKQCLEIEGKEITAR